MPGPDGKIGHAELQIGDSVIMLADEYPDMGVLGPKSIGGTPVTHQRLCRGRRRRRSSAPLEARRHRAAPGREPVLRRPVGQFEDPFGHRWSVATHVEDVPPDEMAKRASRGDERRLTVAGRRRPSANI